MKVTNFAEIEQEFIEKVPRMVLCIATTVDGQNRPRSCILQTLWKGSTGWVMTGRQTLKTKHLAGNPHIALAYLDLAGGFKPVYADCRADWVDELNEKQRVKDLFASTPPLGYDLGLNADHPDYGLLKLTPWRIKLGDWFGEKKIWQVSQS